MTKREERQATMGQIMHQRFHEPWTLAQKPFKVIENVYFVGNTWVSVYLIDTPEGLILIDCAYEENLYLLIDSIRGLGFDPQWTSATYSFPTATLTTAARHASCRK